MIMAWKFFDLILWCQQQHRPEPVEHRSGHGHGDVGQVGGQIDDEVAEEGGGRDTEQRGQGKAQEHTEGPAEQFEEQNDEQTADDLFWGNQNQKWCKMAISLTILNNEHAPDAMKQSLRKIINSKKEARFLHFRYIWWNDKGMGVENEERN